MPALEVKSDDPLNILSSTKTVVESSAFVQINQEQLHFLAEKISKKSQATLIELQEDFKPSEKLENDMQRVFIEDAVNFCFWASKDQQKWQVELPGGQKTQGGWYGLKACLNRAIRERMPILDPWFLANMEITEAKDLFRGVDDAQIPLLKQRLENLQEAGQILLDKFNGQFIHVVEQANFNAVNLVRLVVGNFKSFKDMSLYQGHEVYFYKRAQICPNDLNYIFKPVGKTINGLDKLTAFADYKLPQILRMFGVISYIKELEEKIDELVELPHDSEEEIEIRAATVWAVELLKQLLPKLTAAEIDNTLWLMSQDIQTEAKPYHRTRTIYY